MKTSAVLFAAALARLAAAAPFAVPEALEKREVVHQTVVVPVVQTVVVTTTITLQPGESAPTPAAAQGQAPADPTPPVVPQQEKKKEEPAPAVAPAPVPTPPVAPKQEAKQEAPKQEAPKQEAPKQEAPKQPEQKQDTTAPATGGAGSGSGKATWYEQMGAAGSCGDVHQDSDMIVAMSVSTMTNDLCGKTITVTGPSGKSVKATIADKCMGCSPDHIDLSKGMFDAVGPGDGVIQGVKWVVG